MKPSNNRKEEHRQQEKITALFYVNQCNNSMLDSVKGIMLDNTCGVFWLVREGHNRWNHTSHNADVGNNIDVLNNWNGLNSEDTNWRWDPVYIELRFSFTAGLVFMSIHLVHEFWFRSPWFSCAFVSILLFIVCCVNLLADYLLPFSLPHLFDEVSYCAILCVRQDWTRSHCCQQDGTGLFLTQESLLPPDDDDGSQTQCITNLLKSESFSQNKEVWSFVN